MIIQLGNVFFYTYIVLLTIIIITICLFLRKKSKLVNHRVILVLLFSALILHFVKLFFEPYRSEYPYSIVKVSFENICAVSTLLFPWFYLSKNKVLKDYMVVIGMMSFIMAIIQPNGLMGLNIVHFDVLRYYYAHLVIVLAPLLMVLSGNHHIRYKRLLVVPIIFYGVLILILFNEILLIAIGLIDRDFNALFDPNYRNIALVWGLPKQLESVDWIVPDLFKTIPFGEQAGQTQYWPVLWIVFPAYFVIFLFGLIQYFILKKIIKHKF